MSREELFTFYRTLIIEASEGKPTLVSAAVHGALRAICSLYGHHPTEFRDRAQALVDAADDLMNIRTWEAADSSGSG